MKMRSVRWLLWGMFWLTALSFPARSVASPPGQAPADVFAEALGQANLRSGPGVNYPQVGEIVSGTRYRVLARHARVPWLRLDVPNVPTAWVYQDLVKIQGNLANVPAVSDFPPLLTPTIAPSAVPTASPASSPTTARSSSTPQNSPLPPLTASASPTFSGPFVITLGEANIRFGPDIRYPVIAKVPEGTSLRVLELHARFPWVHIAFGHSPTGSGWIYRDVVRLEGDLTDVPVTDTLEFNYPTLTPTPQTITVPLMREGALPVPSGQLAATLGEAMHVYLLQQGFAPYSEQVASVFVLDLQSGDLFTLNDNVAYSGMSLTKIPILVAYFQRFPRPQTWEEAFQIADTMMCSENITTNQLLERLGDGDSLQGAYRVTAFMQSLGLGGTFITREYLTQPDAPPPSGATIMTGADQTLTTPDPYNQVVPRDLGQLLAGIYQCAQDGNGLLVEHYPDDFTPQMCRRMLYAMDANTINVFLEAGVPPQARVIHKHGWIDDTHGDAGIVIGPDGAFVFVAVLHGREWLPFDLSAPTIAELARMTWNALNPTQPLDAIRTGTVPAECDPTAGNVIQTIMQENLPMLGP